MMEHQLLLRPATLLGAIVILCLACSSCGIAQYQQSQAIERHLRLGETDQALSVIESSRTQVRNKTLNLLNKAMIERLKGDYQASIDTLTLAKANVSLLDATSVTETLGAYTLSEHVRAYQAAVYEKLLVHVMQILNYLSIGQLESARVESRQIDAALSQLSKKGQYYPAGSARHLTGLVYEALNEVDNAIIAYELALENYRNIGVDATVNGLQDNIKYLEERLAKLKAKPSNKNDVDHGHLIILHEIDFIPQAYPRSDSVPNLEGSHWYHFSFPGMESRALYNTRAEVRLHKTGETKLSEVALPFIDVEAMAFAELDSNRAKLVKRTLSRQITKRAMIRKVEEENELLGALLNIADAGLEMADTRNWTTLANRIDITRLALPAGSYELEILVNGQAETSAPNKPLQKIDIEKNKFTFITHRWMSPTWH